METKDRLRDAVKAGRSLSAILADLKTAEPDALTAFRFLKLMFDAVGMRLPDGYRLLENLTPELEPLIPVEEIDRNAEEVLARYR